jgi:hypothetical protein
MAEIPPDDSPANHSRETEAGLMRGWRLRLTDSAHRYAARHQLKSDLERLALGADCLVGDFVSLETGERPHDFIVVSRRWVMCGDGAWLEITLDHPARRGRP